MRLRVHIEVLVRLSRPLILDQRVGRSPVEFWVGLLQILLVVERLFLLHQLVEALSELAFGR